ncbi:MAG: transcriptional repressor LexA [Bacillota bacterium]|jgi:repressor LexA|nr:transcriptional repressor LexA [Candidatus Fermentithermobacillaceae bacterium]
MASLTEQQARVLEVIRESIREHGYPPSVRELGARLGLKSTATVHTHLRNLERKGFLKRAAQKSRAFNLTEAPLKRAGEQVIMVPLVGMVRAGTPVLAVENIEDMVPFPRAFVKAENVFLLRVQGDSMIEAGIFDGDYVLVRQQEHADNGDIVVALLGDEATVKSFYREKDAVRLQPRNSRLAPIVSKDVRVVGKVVGLYRSVR